MPPDVAPVKLINTLKSQLSKEVRLKYREHIEKYLWGDALFWRRSFLADTS
ncbi:transposase [Butyrivibrio sp. AD3002]|uniref:transposase n=1 Tax=Butyrivibrio sp. AD3002 TaxID=1280670 RepID=UPI000423ED28